MFHRAAMNKNYLERRSTYNINSVKKSSNVDMKTNNITLKDFVIIVTTNMVEIRNRLIALMINFTQLECARTVTLTIIIVKKD